MSRRRILFVAEAVTLAHVGRMFRLAGMVDRSRYTPVLAWHPRYNHLLGNVGDEFYPLHSITSDQFVERLRTARPVYDLRTMEVYVAWELEVFREARPDAVVGDFRLSLATSATITGIPYVNVVNAHWSPYARPRFIVPDCPPARLLGPTVGQAVFDVARPFFFLAYASDFNRLAEKFGRLSFGYDLRRIYCEGDRTLYPDLREITPTFDLPPSHRYLGPVTWSPEIPEPEFFRGLPGDRRVVYVNLGTSGDEALLPGILDQLARMPVDVIAATGGKLELPSPAANVHVTDFLPGDAACRLADVMVFNGGVGGTHQAVEAGIPVVGIPNNLDQFLNMHFVERAGLGRIVRSDGRPPRRLAATVEAVLADDGYRRRARELEQRAGAYDPATVLNEVLDDVFDGRPSKRWPTLHRPPALKPPPAQVPEPELVEALAEAAVRAPSSTNCQPWRFLWSGGSLDVCLVPDRAYPFLHFTNPDVAVSLGAAITNMRVAAAARGHRLEVELFPEDARDGLMARVWPVPDAAADGSLLAALAERCTNRRGYLPRPIPADVRDGLLEIARPERPEVRVHWVEEPRHRDLIADSAAVFYQVVFENPTIQSALLEWIRWTDEEEAATRTGLSVPSLELGGGARLAFRLAASRRRARLLAPTGFFRVYRRATSRHLRQSAAFGIITVSENDPAELVHAGEVLERLWLEATRRGLAMHPLGGLPMLALRCSCGHGSGLTERQRRLVEQALATVSRVVPAFTERMPAIMFRIGYAPAPSARSVRLPLEAVFEGATSPRSTARGA